MRSTTSFSTETLPSEDKMQQHSQRRTLFSRLATGANAPCAIAAARNDLQVTANGVKLKPAFALGSWVAFER